MDRYVRLTAALLLCALLGAAAAYAHAEGSSQLQSIRSCKPAPLAFTDEQPMRADPAHMLRGAKPLPPDPSLPALIIFPGHSGSALNVSLANADLPTYCKRDSNWERLWLNLRFLDPFKSKNEEDCWYRMMTQTYDPESNSFLSARGVKVFPVAEAGQSEQGGVDGVEYLVELLYGQRVGAYLHTLVEQLAAIGYARGVNLFAVPYDWRVTPDSMDQHSPWFEDVSRLLERLREQTGRPALAIAHSMGNLQLLYLLRRNGDEWTKRHVGTLFSIAGPWAGASKALRTLLSGDLLFYSWIARLPHFAIFNPRRVRDLSQGMGSVQWLSPSPALWGNEAVVRLADTGEQIYASTWPDLFQRLNRTTAASIWARVRGLEPASGITPVPVELFCFAGVGSRTEISYEYPSLDKISDTEPVAFCGDGDDTVPIHSLRACQGVSSLGPPVLNREYSGISHTSILTSKALFADLIPAILAKRQP